MHYIKSMPWIVKFGSIMISLFKRRDQPLTLATIRTPFCFALLLLVSAALPSLVFSVRHRAQTTQFLVQTLMFGCAAACIVCKIYHSREYHSYAGISMQFMLMHLFFSVFSSVHAQHKLMLYPQALKLLAVVCFVCCTITLAINTPQVEMQLLPTLVVLFLAEMNGADVFLASSLLKAVADLYESLCDHYV